MFGVEQIGHLESAQCIEATHEVVKLVEDECSFLRIHGYGLRPATSERAKRLKIAAALVFYVHGLPWAKRAKWQHPLLWLVAAVLRCRGCPVEMSSGVMYTVIKGCIDFLTHAMGMHMTCT